MPSRFAPILQRTYVAEVGPVPTSTPSRVISIFTGWPVIFDSITAIGSM